MNNYLQSIHKQFEYYRLLGEKTFEQLSDEQLFKQLNSDSNSIAIIVKHLWGNMLSRWTDFLTADGEKPWRKREEDFKGDLQTREELLARWQEGWTCLFAAIEPLTEADLQHIIYIRNQGHTVMEAINRQLAHYAYHVGQIVYIGKMERGKNWISLSISKGESAKYNAEKFNKTREKQHFTDEWRDRSKS